jgi:hypothetical protein
MMKGALPMRRADCTCHLVGVPTFLQRDQWLIVSSVLAGLWKEEYV